MLNEEIKEIVMYHNNRIIDIFTKLNDKSILEEDEICLNDLLKIFYLFSILWSLKININFLSFYIPFSIY